MAAVPQRPKLIVFDLDFTVWYPEMYELAGAPFKKCKNTGRVTDSANEQVQMFTDMHQILHILKTNPEFQDVKISVASSTNYPKWAETCMKLLDVDGLETNLDSLVEFKTIYPRTKTVHFNELRQLSGFEYEDMLFFDNARYNITDVEPLGVTCIHCPNGMTLKVWNKGIEKFSKRHL